MIAPHGDGARLVKRAAVAGVVMAALLSWALASAQVPTKNYIELEWQLGQTRRGVPVVWGYVHNIYGEPIGNVRLAVEETDAAGRAVGRTIVDVYGIVPPKGTAYFEARVPRADVTYRIVVLRFDLMIHPGQGQ